MFRSSRSLHYLCMIFIYCLMTTSCSDIKENKNNTISHPVSGPYLGEAMPDTIPKLFAPGFISCQLNERDAAFSPDGKEFYYSLWTGTFAVILYVKQENNKWTEPEVAEFSGHYSDLEPAFSPDGQKLYFASNRPLNPGGDSKDYDIWVVDRSENGWSEPINLGAPINTDKDEFYPSVTKDGSIYITASYDGAIGGEDIFVSRQKNGRYTKPENLGEAINTKRGEFNAFVAPDESYIIFSSAGREDGLGSADMYISFKKDGRWTPAQNMEPGINSDALDYCPTVTPDGEFLFFTSRRSNLQAYSATKRSYKGLVENLSSALNGNSNIYWVHTSLFLVENR